jgi:polysaccharide export outer membrane protein
MRNISVAVAMLAVVVLGSSPFALQEAPAPKPAPTDGVALPPGYVIGSGDRLAVNFWKEPELSAEVVVRPDGKITVPLLKEVAATGLTPEQLGAQLETLAARFVQEPNATVIVREIHSRQVFITGYVARPGAYPLTTPLTVLQFIAQAGGLLEFANAEEIRIMRTEDQKPKSFRFNYKDITKGRNVTQNIELQPGDTVIVP